MAATITANQLRDAIGALAGLTVERTKPERLRQLAKVQRSEGMASIRRLRQERRWIAKLQTVNPGVGQFYGVPHSAEVRADAARYALSCRRRANNAAAEARALEAADQAKKAA